MEVDHQDTNVNAVGLIDIISRSNSQNLEANIVKRLDSTRSCSDSETNEVNLLAESIFKFENQQDEKAEQEHMIETTKTDNPAIDQIDLKRRIARRKFSITSYERSVVDVLLDLYCRRDPQIVRKKWRGVETEFRLLFEQRRRDGTLLTQSFLLALFIHQANWSNLFECIEYLLDSRSIFSKLNNTYS